MKILVLGGAGLVGSCFLKDCQGFFEINAPTSDEVNILDPDALRRFLDKNQADWIVNFAAFTNVEEAEDQKGNKAAAAFQLNAQGPKTLALLSKEFGIPLVQISTEYVFDGKKSDFPYVEDDKPSPINWYGETKYFGEQFVLESDCELILARISMPYTHFYEGKRDIARTFLKLLEEKQPIKALVDVRITPTLISDITGALKVLIKKDARGIYHLATTTPVSPFDFSSEIAKQFGLDEDLITPTDLQNYNNNRKAAMLKYSWLSPQKFVEEFGGGILRPFKEELEDFKRGVDSLK